MWTWRGDFQVGLRGQGNTPGHALESVRIVHQRHRMGGRGAAHTEKESHQGKVSARVISLPSNHVQTLPWLIVWRNSLSFVENVSRHSL
jgi:mannose/cellobiose epimerase-like protein (N-acyl-D-glucosamine 2-epimerase family)